jgi:hypothetical protein
MPDAVIDPYRNPLLDAFVASHGAIVKSPAAYARQVIKAHVKQRWQQDIEPDDVRLNTFIYSEVRGADIYPATLHTSLCLTDALLRKWHKHLTMFSGLGYVQPYRAGGIPMRLVPSLNTDFHSLVYEGLYRRCEPQTYDADTHLDIDPAEFKKFVWVTDLRQQYMAYLRTFIDAHARHYPVLAKAAFLKAAFLQRDENSLLEIDKQLVLKSLGLPASQQWQALTPELLEGSVPTDPHIVVAPLQIHRYRASDAVVIKDVQTGRTVLYVPGNSSPLHGFDNEQQLAHWVAEQCRDVLKRRSLEGHFPEKDGHDGVFLSGLHNALEGIARYPRWLNNATGIWSPVHCVHAGNKIHGDPFVFLRDRMVERLRSDALFSIHTRGDVRLEGFAQGLNRSLIFTGLVALIVPEAIPYIAGLSISLIGVGAEQAANGRTLHERRQGGERVVFGLLNALPLAAEKLIAVASEAGAAAEEVTTVTVELKPARGPTTDGETQPSNFIRPRFDYEPQNLRSLDARLRESLRVYEAPLDSLRGRPTIHGPNGMLDIYHREGRYFVALHDKAYEVRWEEAARQWRITDGNGKRGPFLKQQENDQWDIDLGGLKGGMEGDQVVPSNPLAAPGPSLHEQVNALYPGFTPDQTAEFLAELRANGTSVEIQLARLAMELKSLERVLERWAKGPMTWRAVTETHSIPVSELARRQAADIIKRCWQRLTPVDGPVALRLEGYVLDLHGIAMGDLPHLPADFSHVTAVNLSRTYISQQSASELLSKTPNLRWLNIENNFLRGVPTSVARLRYLTRLSLANNRIVLTPFMRGLLHPLRTLRLLNLERNPLGGPLDVSSMPGLINLFLRSTGLEEAPAGVFELPQLMALDLRNNRISTLPDAFFETPWAAHRTLLDGNPLAIGTRARIAQIGGPSVVVEPVEGVEVWLRRTPALARRQRRTLWELYGAEEHADDFFDLLARLRSSADFNLTPDVVTERVWLLMEAGADDQTLRSRLVAMAANPQTCVDGATVMFSEMELEVLVTKARALAAAGHEGPQLIKLLRGLLRLEEVDGIARADAAGRIGFTEDVEVLLAYRVGLVSRLDLPLSTRTMQFSGSASVTPEMLDRAEQLVLGRETQAALVEFALKREFWVTYLEERYPVEFLACRKPTELRMGALDDLQSEGAMTDGAYKNAAEEILRQRRADESTLMKQLTQAELAGSSGANSV